MQKNLSSIRAEILSQIEEIKLYKMQQMEDIVKEQIQNLYKKIMSSDVLEKDRSELLSSIEKEIGPIHYYVSDTTLSKNGASNIQDDIKRKIQEIKLYYDQGMHDVVKDLLRETINEINSSSGITDDLKREFLSLIEENLGSIKAYLEESDTNDQKNENNLSESITESGDISASRISIVLNGDPEEQFTYAKSLMNIHDWDEAITVFKIVAATGYKYEECYELCGDCAYKAGRYNEAIEYYEIVYTFPDVSENTKKRIFDKIAKCRQKKFIEKLSIQRGIQKPFTDHESSFYLVSYVEALHVYSGDILRSWEWDKKLPFSYSPRTYQVGELLRLGMTWAVFDVLRKDDGKPFVALTLTPHWWDCIDRNSFVEWVYVSMMMDSEYLSIPEDLAVASDGRLFVIRPYYQYSLFDYMAGHSDRVDIDEVLVIAYQILEGLGYLHLHFARDKQKRKIYHLDLRPSRVFFVGGNRVKVAYGGLWRILTNFCPHLVNYRRLPLNFLSYRAPEQFRPYLWSIRRPLVCTDVYQFGVIFYELLTGINPFTGESVEEIEMLHCDQKPIPPQVIRPDLPEEVSELVMGCLNTFPSKRWRSTTQILLAIEKMLGGTSRIREIMFRKKGGDS